MHHGDDRVCFGLGLPRGRMAGKPLFKTIAMIPILVPSLLPGLR